MENLSPFFDTIKWALNNTWPMLVLFVVIICVIRISMFIINHQKVILYKEFYGLLAVLYFMLLYYLLLSTERAASGINLIPFKEMTRYTIGSKAFMYNVIGNIALFIPFGYFVSSFLKANKIQHIIIPTFIISLAAEFIQYRIGRAFDVDDVILNVMGALLGFMFYACLMTLKKYLPKFMQRELFYNIIAIAIGIIIIIFLGKIWGLGWY